MTIGPMKPADADTPDASEEESFLARWSKRKHASIKQSDASEPAPISAGAEPAAAATPVLTDKDMPPIESITEDSDVSGFFSPGVSEELRRLALHKLFHLPAFNTRCPLDSEYYDYMANLTPLGSVVTHEMREQMEREAEKLAAAALDKALDGEPGAAPKPNATPVIASEATQAPKESQVDSGAGAEQREESRLQNTAPGLLRPRRATATNAPRNDGSRDTSDK